MDRAEYALRVTARDHGRPPRTAHVDLIVVVDSSIPYTADRHRRPPAAHDDDRASAAAGGLLVDANLPFVLAALALCAAFVVIAVVLIACAATACAAGRRRAGARARQQVRAQCRLYLQWGPPWAPPQPNGAPR